MNWKSTLGLALCLGLLCLAYWGMQQREISVAREAVAAQKVFGFGGEAVQRLRITRLNEDPSEAVRGEGGQWAMVLPNPTVAPFQLMWNRVADNLAGLMNARSLEGWSGEEAEYGLAPPALTVVATTADGVERRLTFGASEPTGNFRYARLNEAAPFLITEDAFFELNRPLTELRNRFLVDDREANLLRLEVARIWTGTQESEMAHPPEVGEESVRVTVARADAQAPWRLVSPMEVEANQEAVEELVKEIQFAVCQNHVDDPEALADYGLDPARVRITVVDDQQGREQTIFLGGLDESEGSGGLFARRADRQAVFVIDPHLFSLLPRSPLALREKRLLTHRASDIERLAYEGASGRFVIEREAGGGWKLAEPAYGDSDPLKLSDYLSYVKAVEGQRFPEGDAADFGLDHPVASITLNFAGEAAPAVIRFAPYKKDPLYYCATQDTGAVTLMLAQHAEGLLVAPAWFQSLRLMRFEKAAARRIDLELEDTHYAFVYEHGRWGIAAPEGLRLSSQDDIALLLSAFANLYADAKLEERLGDRAACGLDAPPLSIAFTLDVVGEEAPVFGPLEIGAVTPKDPQLRFAALAGKAGLYAVSQEVVQVVRESLRGVTPVATP